jgi:capsular exopolysaccharide synthesis family protein
MIFDQNASGYGWIDYFHLLRSRWQIVLLVCSLFLLGGAALQKKVPRLHESVVRLELGTGQETPDAPARSLSEFQASQQNDFSRQIAELRSHNLFSEVVVACDLVKRWGAAHDAHAIRLLEARSEVEALPQDRAIVLRARDLNPAASAELVNAMADQFLSRKESEIRGEANARVVRLEREVGERHRAIESIEARLVELGADATGSEEEKTDLRRQLVSEGYLLRSLEAKHQLAAVEAGEAKSQARLVERAAESSARLIVPLLLTLPSLLFLGLLSGVVVTILAERGDIRLNFLANLMQRAQLPLAGFAPTCGESLITGRLLPTRLIESYRDLRTKLQRLPAGDCLLMTLMPLRGRDGLAEATTNLACVLADGGSTVLVIDADFRNPQLHRHFDAANHPGLSDFLSGEMRIEETVIKTLRPNLWFMPSGPLHQDPAGLIAGRRMGDLLWDMRSRFDYLLIAAPSIHEVAEAGNLAALADYTAVVTPYRDCTVPQLKKARLAIESASAQLTAVFLTVSLDGAAADVPQPAGSVPVTVKELQTS